MGAYGNIANAYFVIGSRLYMKSGNRAKNHRNGLKQGF